LIVITHDKAFLKEFRETINHFYNVEKVILILITKSKKFRKKSKRMITTRKIRYLDYIQSSKKEI